MFERVSGPTRALLAAIAAAIPACGGGGGGGASNAPTNPVPSGPTIRITAAGLTPARLEVASGSVVVFANADTRSHEPSSDPHPTHTDCPPFASVGVLLPGQQRATGPLPAGTCAFHDHLSADERWKGQVVAR
jgi:hypothetical protein